MSEQDAEPVEVEETESEEVETAPQEEKKAEFTEEQEKSIQNRMSSKAFDVREQKRQNAVLRRELDEAKSKVPEVTRPDVQGTGDIYDEDYESQRQAREEQIRAQVEFDTRRQVGAEQAQQTQAAEFQKQQASFDEALTKFNGSAVKFDVDPAQLDVMDKTIASYGGLSPTVGQFVLNDDQGMLIYKHMASNPDDIQRVNTMDPMAAGIFLNDIKTKQAALFTKKTSGAPDPADRPEGGGVDSESGKYPHSGGATFT